MAKVVENIWIPAAEEAGLREDLENFWGIDAEEELTETLAKEIDESIFKEALSKSDSPIRFAAKIEATVKGEKLYVKEAKLLEPKRYVEILLEPDIFMLAETKGYEKLYRWVKKYYEDEYTYENIEKKIMQSETHKTQIKSLLAERLTQITTKDWKDFANGIKELRKDEDWIIQSNDIIDYSATFTSNKKGIEILTVHKYKTASENKRHNFNTDSTVSDSKFVWSPYITHSSTSITSSSSNID